MGGKSSASPPDYSALAASSAESAKLESQTSREQLDWATSNTRIRRRTPTPT